jgi:uncharacterized protein (TIGR02679 family)
MNVQSSSFSTSESLECVINLAVAPVPWVGWQRESLGMLPKTINESLGMYRQRFVPGLVLRALGLWHGAGMPVGAEQQRALWELAGVVPDDLASQVLVLALPATGGIVGDWLTTAASAGVPFRVTLHQLRLSPLLLDCDEIFVCENPAALRAAASRPSRPLVCTEGVPSGAVHVLLRAARPRTRIHWGNDFDWAGVRLTAAALARYRAPSRGGCSLRTTSARRRRGVPLIGTPATTSWDPRLAAAMRAKGRAVMEERLLDALLEDLHAPMSR